MKFLEFWEERARVPLPGIPANCSVMRFEVEGGCGGSEPGGRPEFSLMEIIES